MAPKAAAQCLILAICVLTFGCASELSDHAARMQRGYVYYLDGAGGGGITNWASGVRKGLLDAGYNGSGEMFSWETGLGLMADQTASNEYKRGKAAELAQKIVEYRQKYPQTPITLMGLSAGTVMSVFTLESLPDNLVIDNVVLLSGSLSATYDLSQAMRRVHGRVYVSTSQHDIVLAGLLPFAGTADRDSGTSETIGVQGPQVPRGASDATRQLYESKLVLIPWKTEFAHYGNVGRHTDTVSARFIQHFVAPLIETGSGTQIVDNAAPPEGLVENPDYRRWSRFPVGTWTIIHGELTVAGKTYPFQLRTTLLNKTAVGLIFRREQLETKGGVSAILPSRTLYEFAHVIPENHPVTHPAAKIKPLPNEVIQIGARSFDCATKAVAVDADFDDWGRNPRANVFICDDVPGGIARLELETTVEQRQVKLHGQVVEFHIPHH